MVHPIPESATLSCITDVTKVPESFSRPSIMKHGYAIIYIFAILLKLNAIIVLAII